MVFSSLTFLCIFLPVILILDRVLPGVRTRNILLLIASLIFYAYGEPVCVRLMIASCILNYIWALLIGKNRVNFYGNSSFCPADCDKIISIWECKIPGLFSLPLALVRETASRRVTEERPRDLNLLRRAMEQQLHERLLRAVEDGVVEEEHYTCARSGGRLTVCLRARCSENIAKEQKK